MQTILDKAVERYRRDKFVRDGGGRVGREDVERTVSKPTHDLNPPN